MDAIVYSTLASGCFNDNSFFRSLSSWQVRSSYDWKRRKSQANILLCSNFGSETYETGQPVQGKPKFFIVDHPSERHTNRGSLIFWILFNLRTTMSRWDSTKITKPCSLIICSVVLFVIKWRLILLTYFYLALRSSKRSFLNFFCNRQKWKKFHIYW